MHGDSSGATNNTIFWKTYAAKNDLGSGGHIYYLTP